MRDRWNNLSGKPNSLGIEADSLFKCDSSVPNYTEHNAYLKYVVNNAYRGIRYVRRIQK